MDERMDRWARTKLYPSVYFWQGINMITCQWLKVNYGQFPGEIMTMDDHGHNVF